MAKQQLQEQTRQHALAEYVQILKTGAPRDENGGVVCHKKLKKKKSVAFISSSDQDLNKVCMGGT